MKNKFKRNICFLFVFCMLVPQLSIAKSLEKDNTVLTGSNNSQVLLRVINGQVSFAEIGDFSHYSETHNTVPNNADYFYATKLSPDVYFADDQYFIDCGNNQLLYVEKHTLSLTNSTNDEINLFGESIDLSPDQIEKIISEKSLVSNDADAKEAFVSVYSTASSPVYSDWVVGYGGAKYRTMIIEFKNLGSEYKNIATGTNVNNWLQSAAVVLLEKVVTGLVGSNIGILSGLSTLASLLSNGTTITATSTSKLQFGGGWEKTSKYTYIEDNANWKISCDRVYIKEVDFNFFDPSASVINRTYQSFPQKTLISDHYDDADYCQQFAYNYRGASYSAAEQFTRYAIYGGPNQQYVAYVTF